MVPIAHPTLDFFLLIFIAALSAAATIFFLRYWKETRDSLFLAFAVFFAVEGGTRAFDITTPNPNLIVGWVYVLRLVSVLLIVAVIPRRNTRSV